MIRRNAPVDLQPAPGLEEYHDFNKPEDLEKYRSCLAAGTLKDGKLPDDVSVRWITLNGVRAAEIRISGAPEEKLIFHIHGGAWNGGVPCTEQRAFIEIQQKVRTNIISVEYGLAPEHPYPEGLNDCITAYLAVLDRGYQPENICIMGESAGGNLCLALGLYLKEHNFPLPGSVALISPCVKMNPPTELKRIADEHPDDLKLLENYETYRMYILDHDCKDPYISPCYGDFHGFPPVLVQFGGSEFLYEDGVLITRRLMEDGVDVRAHCWEYMPHVFLFLCDLIPEAALAQDELADFIQNTILSY